MKYNALGNYRYLSILQICSIALIGTFCIIVYTETKDYDVLLSDLRFYIAWLINSLMASLVIGLTVYVNRLLDNHYPWLRNYGNRLKQQFIWGIMLPLGFTVVLVAVYFGFYKVNLFKTIYFSKILFVEVLFILLLNFCLYLLHQRHSARKEKARQKEAKQLKDLKYVIDFNEVGYFYAKDKVTFWVNHQGLALLWFHSITATRAMVSARDFFLIRRGFLLGRAAIAEVIKQEDVYRIRLKSAFDKEVWVSRSNARQFNTWWYQPELY